jgi:hypothetical protein
MPHSGGLDRIEMSRWRVDIFRKVRATLGTVEAADENSAIVKAVEQFHITPKRQDKILVTRLDSKRH